jgi:hypothetical protein
MFREEPHTAAKNYKLLREQIGTECFLATDKLDPYFVSALAAYKLELQYRNKKLGSEYKSARYHLLLALRFLMDEKPLPPMNSKDMEKRCAAMIALLSDDTKTDELFKKAQVVIDKVADGDLTRDHIRTIVTTQLIVNMLKKP